MEKTVLEIKRLAQWLNVTQSERKKENRIRWNRLGVEQHIQLLYGNAMIIRIIYYLSLVRVLIRSALPLSLIHIYCFFLTGKHIWVDFTKSQKGSKSLCTLITEINWLRLYNFRRFWQYVYLFNLPKRKGWKPVLYSKLNSNFYTCEVNPYVFAS